MIEHFCKLRRILKMDLKEASGRKKGPPAWKEQMLAAYQVDSRKKTHGNRMIFFPNLFLTGIKLFDNLTKLNKTFGIGNDDWPVE